MTKDKIRAVLDDLNRRIEAMWRRHDAWAAAHPDEDRPRICDGVGLIGRCTDTSVWLADRLDGVVYGYLHKENPDAELGRAEFGHDFVVVDDRWLVDWWAFDTYQKRDLYDLRDPQDATLVRKLYGPMERWSAMGPQAFDEYLQNIRQLRQG